MYACFQVHDVIQLQQRLFQLVEIKRTCLLHVEVKKMCMDTKLQPELISLQLHKEQGN